VKKQFAVIGLGTFGFYIAKGLAENGMDVIAIDIDEEKIDEIKDFVPNSLILDSSDKKALKEAGIVNMDVVLVSVGSSIEDSILTVMAVRDVGNQNIIAKAISPSHGEILAKLGVFRVLYPEREVAKKLVKDFVINPLYEIIDVSNTLKILKFIVGDGLSGLLLSEIEKEHSVKVVSIKKAKRWEYKKIEIDYKIQKGDVVCIMGDAKIIKNLYNTL